MEDKKPTDTPEVNTGDETTPEPAPETTPETATPAPAAPEAPAAPTATENAVTTASESTSEQAGGAHVMRNYLIALVLVLLIAAGLWYALEKQGRVSTAVFEPILSAESTSASAAVVNGVTITEGDIDDNMASLLQNASVQGMDVNDPTVRAQLEDQALTMLINTELLRQEVESSGVSVDEAEVDARYAQLEQQLGGPEALATQLATAGVTEQQLRTDIRDELAIQNHLNSAIDTSSIMIEESDKIALYDEFGGEEAGLPPYEEVQAQIEAQLRSQAEQELIGEYLDGLRENAEIEISEE